MNRIFFFLSLFFLAPLQAQFFMYPGDTNNDGVANYIDVLPIGLAYQAEGPPREIPTTNWNQQEFFPFGQILPFSGVEYGFIDCDGNGFIDSLDVEAIALNYDSTQMDAFPPPMPYELSDTLFTSNIPEVSISFNVDTAFVMDTFFAEINILFPGGMASEPALGLALGLEYDPDYVKDSLTVIFPDTLSNDLMFVSAASNFLSFWRLPPPGRVEIGAAGRGQNVINGNRMIATVRIIVEDVILRGAGEIPFYFSFTDILLINDQEMVLETFTHSDTLLLLDTILGTQSPWPDQDFYVFPNPSKDYLTIESPAFVMHRITLTNQMGQVVVQKEGDGNRRFHLQINHLPTGFYLLQITTSAGILTKKILIHTS